VAENRGGHAGFAGGIYAGILALPVPDRGSRREFASEEKLNGIGVRGADALEEDKRQAGDPCVADREAVQSARAPQPSVRFVEFVDG
jgi:hypothetical protein